MFPNQMEYEKTDSKIQEKYKWVNDAIRGYFTFSSLKSFLEESYFQFKYSAKQ